jgi:hypothetical protein
LRYGNSSAIIFSVGYFLRAKIISERPYNTTERRVMRQRPLHSYFPLFLALACNLRHRAAGRLALAWLADRRRAAGRRRRRRRVRIEARVPAARPDDYLASRSQFGEEVAGVWTSHIDASRTQMETRSSRWSSAFPASS